MGGADEKGPETAGEDLEWERVEWTATAEESKN